MDPGIPPFWATVCKTVHPTLSDRCLSVCLSVCLVTLVYRPTVAKQWVGSRCHLVRMLWMVHESGESTEGECGRDRKRQVRDRETGTSLTERSVGS